MEHLCTWIQILYLFKFNARYHCLTKIVVLCYNFNIFNVSANCRCEGRRFIGVSEGSPPFCVFTLRRVSPVSAPAPRQCPSGPDAKSGGEMGCCGVVVL